MLQGKACLLTLPPGPVLALTPAFCSARPPLIFRREKKRNMLLTRYQPSHSLLKTPLLPSPHPSSLSPALSLCRAPPRPPPRENPLLFLPHSCSLPHGWQGKTDWCRQLDWSWAGSGPEKPGGGGGVASWVGGTFPGLGRHPTSPRVTSDHLGTHTHRLVQSTYMRATAPTHIYPCMHLHRVNRLSRIDNSGRADRQGNYFRTGHSGTMAGLFLFLHTHFVSTTT